MNKRRVVTRALASVALAGSLVAITPSAASADWCSTQRYTDAYGHAIVYRCGSYVNGTVYDDRADGKCAYYWVYFDMPGGYQQVFFSDNACGKGNSKNFYIDAGAGAAATTDGIAHT